MICNANELFVLHFYSIIRKKFEIDDLALSIKGQLKEDYMANQNIQIILMIRQTLQHVGNDIEKKIFDRNEEINSNRLKIVNIFHIRL